MKRQLQYKNSIINYYVLGNGPKVLFCLHGYDEKGSSFQIFENILGVTYTMYAIDFPFHGETKWNENVFTSEDLLTIFSIIHQTEKFALLAYSMGGRVALHLIKTIPQKIERAVLVAPDGLHLNFWYWLATQTSAGNSLFKQTMQNPKLFFSILDSTGKLNVVNKSIIKFVHHFLDDANERTLLYKRWTIMRKFKPDLNAILKICANNNIVLHFVFGSFDRIILSKRADVFKKAKNIHIKIIEAGHNLLKEKYADEIASLLIE